MIKKPFRLDLSRPRVMAILNVTPDSFYAESRQEGRLAIEKRLKEIIEQGAYMVDIGGCSTRPGAEEPSPEEELRRLSEALEVVRRVAPELPVSVDSFRSSVVRPLVEQYGPLCINDISAAERDPELVDLAVAYDLPYIAMHMRGDACSMQQLTSYEDVVEEVVEYLAERLEWLHGEGIEQVILDPGFGFAKRVEQNYSLLKGLNRLVALGAPVMAALSRKSMIYKVLDKTSEGALAGTTALNWEALRQGARLLRVHDVREAVEVCRIYELFNSAS